jgi:hypothetical protein
MATKLALTRRFGRFLASAPGSRSRARAMTRGPTVVESPRLFHVFLDGETADG